ncbi:MAG TPA: hypothetical protein VH417_02715 [Vicinamibacterales bacterium]
MSVYRRRTAIVAGAILIVLVAFLAAALADRLGARIDPFQVAWVTLSVEIVAAVYKWGVGGWSRYTPPAPSPSSSAGTPEDVTLAGAAPPSPGSPVPADPHS